MNPPLTTNTKNNPMSHKPTKLHLKKPSRHNLSKSQIECSRKKPHSRLQKTNLTSTRPSKFPLSENKLSKKCLKGSCAKNRLLKRWQTAILMVKTQWQINLLQNILRKVVSCTNAAKDVEDSSMPMYWQSTKKSAKRYSSKKEKCLTPRPRDSLKYKVLTSRHSMETR
jgi:hypothetical protein